MKWTHLKLLGSEKKAIIYLNFYVPDFINGSNNRPSDHWREYVSRKVTTGISAFDELKQRRLCLDVKSLFPPVGPHPRAIITNNNLPPLTIHRSFIS